MEMVKNVNNSFEKELTMPYDDENNPQGYFIQNWLIFKDSDAKSLIPPSNFQFSITGCKTDSLVATPAAVTIKQMETPQTIVLANPTFPAACGSFTYAISPVNNFVVLSGSTITISPILSTTP